MNDRDQPAGRMQGYFVTGTDTGVGKTLIAAGLLRAAADLGLRAVGLKPVAAGCIPGPDGSPVNEDALELRAAASISIGIETVNPFVFAEPIAPHIAADRSGRQIRRDDLVRHCRSVCQDYAPQWVVVEGAGGWAVPLNATETMADFCAELDFPVIIVVGMRLGCLNHALLTARAVLGTGLAVAGWVANCTAPDMDAFDENLQTLRERLPAPLLGVVPFLGENATADRAADCLRLDQLDGYLLTGAGV